MQLLEGDLFHRVVFASGVVELTPRDVTTGPRRSVRDALEAVQGWCDEQNGPVRLLLDLSEVRGFCSTEFGVLVRLLDSINDRGGALRLCSLPPELRDIFRFTRLDQVFAIDPDQSRARSLLETRPEPAPPPT
jgi:anti-anti-sigma factor